MSIAVERGVDILIATPKKVQYAPLTPEKPMVSYLRSEEQALLKKQTIRRLAGSPLRDIPSLAEQLDILGFRGDEHAISVSGSSFTATTVYKITTQQEEVFFLKHGEDVPKEAEGAKLFLQSGFADTIVPSVISEEHKLWLMEGKGETTLRNNLKYGRHTRETAAFNARYKLDTMFKFFDRQVDVTFEEQKEPVSGIQPQEYDKLLIKSKETLKAVHKNVEAKGVVIPVDKICDMKIKVKKKTPTALGEKLWEEIPSYNDQVSFFNSHMKDSSGEPRKAFPFEATMPMDLSTKNSQQDVPDSDMPEEHKLEEVYLIDFGGFISERGNFAESLAIASKSDETLTHHGDYAPLRIDTMIYDSSTNTLFLEGVNTFFNEGARAYEEEAKELISQESKKRNLIGLQEEVLKSAALSRFGELGQGRNLNFEEAMYLLCMSGKRINEAQKVEEERRQKNVEIVPVRRRLKM